MSVDFRDNMLIKTRDSKTVYVTKRGKRYSFYSGAQFLSHGYDFNDIAIISNNDMKLIEDAGPLH